MRLRENSRSASAVSTFLPRIICATRLSFCGETLRFLTTARASVSASARSRFALPILLSLARLASPPPASLPCMAFLSPLCEWNVRMGENSPNLWPIMSSVTFTGMNFWPL